MRKIGFHAIVTFLLLVMLSVVAATFTTAWTVSHIPLGIYQALANVATWLSLLYAFAVVAYRGFLRIYPLKAGEITEGSREEFGYQVYILFYLVLFYALTRSRFLPVPLTRPLYLALGAKLGENTYSGGTIMDPPLTSIGANTLIGDDAVLICHAIEGGSLSHAPIVIGDHATIGAKAVVLPGVTIENQAIVAAGAVVAKGTHIKSGEIWVGIPARPFKKACN